MTCRTLIFIILAAHAPLTAQVCGDCDNDGDVDILDALELAQGAAAIIVITPVDYPRCDVDDSGTVTVLDSLLVAQVAAGLPVVLTCPSGNGAPTVSAVVPRLPAAGDVTIDYDLLDPEGDLCDITVLQSTDGGMTFAAATAGAGGDGTTALMSTPGGLAHVFVWDSMTDLGTLVTSGSSVVIRITPDDGMVSGTPGQSAGFDIKNGVSYSQEIEPTILMGPGTSGCMTCHNICCQSGGLILDTYADLMVGGFSGAVVIPGDPNASRIICKLEGGPCGSRMPAGGRPAWSPAMIQVFRDWITEGANDN